MMAVAINGKSALTAMKPRLLFSKRRTGLPGIAGYDVDSEGRRFIMTQENAAGPGTQLNVVVNWFEELKAKAGGAIKK